MSKNNTKGIKYNKKQMFVKICAALLVIAMVVPTVLSALVAIL